MTIEQRLNQLAAGYRAQGYSVVLQPGPEDLPDFAKDFKVEIVASRGDGCVIASVKKDRADLEADRELPRYAEIIEKQPGWRFDLMILAPRSLPIRAEGEAKEPSEEEFHRAVAEIERMLQAGFARPALIAAWAVLETAMRRRLQAMGEEAGWGSSPRSMLNELYSSGQLEDRVFRDLEGLFHVRNAIVHGFTPPVVEDGAVRSIVETARMLLEESLVPNLTA